MTRHAVRGGVHGQPEGQVGPVEVQRVVVHVGGREREVHRVAQLQHHLQAGDAYQIVPSRTFSLPCPAPLASYQRLRRTNPSPYMFYLRSDHRTLFGASPERCVGVDGPSHKVQIRPIAGTAPRGRDGGDDP